MMIWTRCNQILISDPRDSKWVRIARLQLVNNIMITDILIIYFNIMYIWDMMIVDWSHFEIFSLIQFSYMFIASSWLRFLSFNISCKQTTNNKIYNIIVDYHMLRTWDRHDTSTTSWCFNSITMMCCHIIYSAPILVIVYERSYNIISYDTIPSVT